MNLLAHLWLADRSQTSAAGQILGDLIKGRLEQQPFGPIVKTGIRLHRRIDSRCDAHREHRALRQSFEPPLRRYAGIIVDIGFDHALARDWSDFSVEPLPQFADRIAGRVRAGWPAAAPQSAPEPAGLAALLSGYEEERGIARALGSVGTRLHRPNPLHRALPALVRRNERFSAALPELMDALEAEISQQQI